MVSMQPPSCLCTGITDAILVAVGAMIETSPQHSLPPPAVAMLAHAACQDSARTVTFCSKHVSQAHRSVHKVVSVSGKTVGPWYDLAHTSGPLLFTSVVLEWETPADAVQRIIDRCPKLTSLDVRSFRAPLTLPIAGPQLNFLKIPYAEVTSPLLSDIAQRYPNLTSVTFPTRATLDDLSAFLKSCPRLTAVHLARCEHNILSLLASHVGDRLQSVVLPLLPLRVAELPDLDDELDCFATACPNVRALTDPNDTPRISVLLCHRWPHLRKLRLGSWTASTVDLSFVATLRNLVALDINFPNVPEETLRSIVRQCCQIESLLVAVPRLGDRFLFDVAACLPKLRALSVSSSHSVTDAGLCSIVRRCRGLERLACSAKRRGITDVSLRELARYSVNLRWVTIYDARLWIKRGRLNAAAAAEFRSALPRADLMFGYATSDGCASRAEAD